MATDTLLWLQICLT